MMWPDEAFYTALEALTQPRAAGALPATLAPMQALLAALGNPERAYPIITVAGSTGKGTTALRLAAGLASGGLRVGLYTSPHLHSFRERFAILASQPLSGPTSSPGPLSARGEGENIALTSVEARHALPLQVTPLPQGEGPGVRAAPSPSARAESGLEGEVIAEGPWGEVVAIISAAAFVNHAHAVLNTAASLSQSPSTFEYATALALRWFAHEAVDVAVCEIGLGGRFDAVNAAGNQLALIGPIELEHAAMLGGSLESIAWHKAGIISAGGAAIVLPPVNPVVRTVFEQEAVDKQASLTYANDLAQAGLAWFMQLGIVGETASIPASIALPGRLERAIVGEHNLIIDGGHTPLAARRLAAAVAPDLQTGVRVIIGLLADKDASAYLRELDMPGLMLVLTTTPAERARPAEALALAFTAQHARVEVQPMFEKALAAAFNAPERTIAMAGSLRMAAAAREALGLLNEAALEEAQRTRALFEGPGYRAKWGG